MDGTFEAGKPGPLEAEARYWRRRAGELEAENTALRAAVELLTQRVDELTRQVAELTKALSEAQRANKRQSAPFRRKHRQSDPKPPGRKPGHEGEHRAIPKKVDRRLQGPPLKACPECGEPVDHVHRFTNYETDLPPIKPQVTEFGFDGAWCHRCKKRVFAPHPEQTSTGIGAAASHLGPRVRGFMVDLKHRLGVPYHKIEEVLKTHFDLKVSSGGIVQASYRLTELARPTFEEVKKELARSSLVHVDETGWNVQSESWWLWVACTEQFTVYRITDHRSAKAVMEILGPAFGGRLCRDGWASYDKQLESWSMLRCLRHLKHNAEDLLNQQQGGAKETPGLFMGWFEAVLALKKRGAQAAAENYAKLAADLKLEWDWMLEHVRLADSNKRNLGFRKRLAAAESEILPIVREAALPATNNQAERQIRPAVIIRKISAGNKTERGAKTHEVLASLAATCRQQGVPFSEVASRILLAPKGQAVRFWPTSPVPS